MRWVLLALAVLLAALAVSRLRLVLGYDGAFSFTARFWFFRFPGKAHKKKKQAGPVKKKAASAKGEAVFVPDWSFFLTNLSDVFGLTGKLASATGRRLTVDRLTVDLRIREEDAAATAIRYGQACGVVYTAVGFLQSVVRVRRREITVVPLFQEGAAGASVSAVLSIRVYAIVTLLLTQGAGIVKLLLAFFRASRQKSEQRAQDNIPNLQKDGVKS